MPERQLCAGSRFLLEAHITAIGEVAMIVNVEFPFERLAEDWRERVVKYLNEAIDLAVAERQKSFDLADRAAGN